jgi:hypothetical protein
MGRPIFSVGSCHREHASLLFLFVLLIGGCARYSPAKEFSTAFTSRAETQSAGDVRVSAVVLSGKESEEVFAASLAKHKIQPVWLKIENGEDQRYTLMLLSIDRNYFSPSEAAWRSRRLGEGRTGQKMLYFYEQHVPVVVGPHKTVSGFVYTNLDPGAKTFTVQLLGERDVRSFDFAMLVPGFKADFMREQLRTVLTDVEVRNVDRDGLRTYLESLPACVLGGDRETPGDPLNLVIVGEGRRVAATLVSRGWDFTETLTWRNAWQTAMSSLFGIQYRTAPVSALYLFDRPHDTAFQKTRGDVDERNHLRLWRAPIDCGGEPVWVGQISRDIGVKLSSKTLVTHKIDPVVDESRFYLELDLVASGHVGGLAFAKGVGRAPMDAPRYNFTEDPYFTDGLRLVLFLDDQNVAFNEIEWPEWEPHPDSTTMFGLPDD